MPLVSFLLCCIAFSIGGYGQSQMLKSELSFGQDHRISHDLIKVPHFNVIGEPILPQILSNKVILTPPVPGNQRGAIWTEDTMKYSAWETDIEFRASGPERGGGKFAVWLAKNGEQTVGTSSIYTAGKFEGLCITVDNYGGTGGTIRGFLNDGKIDFKGHHSVDSIAFGHCSYSYRNLGRLSQLKIFQDHHNFKVQIDDNLCFETSKVQIPIDYKWGATAVSAETPDSFEINALKVIAYTFDFEASKQALEAGQAPASPPTSKSEQQPSFIGQAAPLDDPAQIEASKVPVAEQFADLHNRLQAVHSHITRNHQDFVHSNKLMSEQLHNIETLLRGREAPPNPMDAIRDLKEKMEALDMRLQHIQNSVGDTWHIEDLKRTVQESHSTLLKRAPGLGMLLFIIVGSQAALVGVYIFYKRRRANSPKKYL